MSQRTDSLDSTGQTDRLVLQCNPSLPETPVLRILAATPYRVSADMEGTATCERIETGEIIADRAFSHRQSTGGFTAVNPIDNRFEPQPQQMKGSLFLVDSNFGEVLHIRLPQPGMFPENRLAPMKCEFVVQNSTVLFDCGEVLDWQSCCVAPSGIRFLTPDTPIAVGSGRIVVTTSILPNDEIRYNIQCTVVREYNLH